MKKLLQAAALLLLSTINFQLSTVFAQGTAFTYQGRLNNAGAPANGNYDFQFVLSNAPSGGSQIGGTVTSLSVGVTNGLFTTTLDFGAVFAGQPTWLGISVRTNGANTYAGLAPSQALTPTPYAVFANTASTVSGAIPSAGLSGTYGNAVTLSNAANQISGAFTGNGANVTNVNASTLGGFNSTGFWKTNGNTGANPTNGAYIGTADNLPIEFKVFGQRALRLEYSFDVGSASVAPNLIGGASGNIVSNGIFGAFIGGGAQNSAGGNYSSVVGGGNNIASGSTSTAMGDHCRASGDNSTAMGLQSVASGDISTGMGYHALASGAYSTAMGYNTTASNLFTTAMGHQTVAGGSGSTAMGYGTIASGLNSTSMGEESTASAEDATATGFATLASGYSSTAMGDGTIASGDDSTAMGSFCHAAHNGSFVWADDSSFTYFTSSAPNQFLLRASGGVGINTTNPGSPFTIKTANSSLGMEQTDGTIRIATYVGGALNGGYLGTVSNHKLGFFINNGPANMVLSTNGFVGIGTASPTNALDVAGNIDATGKVFANGVLLTSDRNAKENFSTISPEQVLQKVAGLPITEWNYKNGSSQERHLGPMAQDFQAVFGLNGDDTRHISVVDENGVALAAIQGLNEKLEVRSERLELENAELKARLEKLEAVMKQFTANK